MIGGGILVLMFYYKKDTDSTVDRAQSLSQKKYDPDTDLPKETYFAIAVVSVVVLLISIVTASILNHWVSWVLLVLVVVVFLLVIAGTVLGFIGTHIYGAGTPEQKRQALEKKKLSVGDQIMSNNDSMSNDLLALTVVDGQLRNLLKSDLKLQRKVEDVVDYYRPSRGKFTSWWQRGKAEGREKLLTVINNEQRLLIEQAAMLERAALDNDKAQMEFQMFVAHNAVALYELKAKAKLIDQATQVGMVPEHYSEVSAYKAKAEVDKDVHAWKVEQNLSAAERYKMTEDSVTRRLREELIEVIAKRDAEIEDPTDKRSKPEIIAIHEQHIANLKFRIKAREDRLAKDESGI